MKRLSHVILASGAALLLAASCGRGQTEISLSASFSEDSLCEVQIIVPCFSSRSRALNRQLERINSRLEIMADSASAAVQEVAEDVASMVQANELGQPPWKCELQLQGQCTYVSRTLISVLVDAYAYLGGAHGMSYFAGLNFDVPTGELLSTEQLLDMSQCQRMDSLLAACFSDPEGCFWEAPTVRTATAVTISDGGVGFHYESYVLGPYSSGPLSVTVPMEQIAPMLRVQL